MDIVSQKFGIQFPAAKKAGAKKIHSTYVPNLKVPQTLDLHSMEHLENVIGPLISLYDELWRKLAKTTGVQIKYLHWLRKITDNDEFQDLGDVRNYLSQSGIEKEPKVGDVSIKLEKFHGDIKYKLEGTLRELEKSVEVKLKSDSVIKNNADISALESNINNMTLTVEKLSKENETLKWLVHNDMAHRIETLEGENKKLRSESTEHLKQLQRARAEVLFHKSKLNSAKEKLVVISKEKTDLIDTIGQIEVKEEGLHSLKARVNKLTSENDRLRNVVQNIDEH